MTEKKYRPCSSVEGELFMADWCKSCAADSVLMQQDGGGSCSIWFHTFTDTVFTMSQGNEQHVGIYTYRPKPK